MEKKRYWLKLEKDFLQSKYIKIIKGFENGRDYILFYLALMLESIESVGHLRFTELVPYNEKLLASLTDTNVDIVRGALNLFQQLGLLTVLEDGTIFLPEVPKMTGKESESAERVRQFRERQKVEALQCNGNVTNSNDNKEKEKEEDKEEEEEKEKEEERQGGETATASSKKINLNIVLQYWNSLSPPLPKYRYTVMNLSNGEGIGLTISAYSQDEIIQAVKNYSEIVSGKDKYKAMPEYGGLAGFLAKGVEKYADDAYPFDRCLLLTYDDIREKRDAERQAEIDAQLEKELSKVHEAEVVADDF